MDFTAVTYGWSTMLSPWHHKDVRPDRVIVAVEAETFWTDPDQDRVSWFAEDDDASNLTLERG